jgi:cell wall-active antibiotic response 4TMS protein YvqF
MTEPQPPIAPEDRFDRSALFWGVVLILGGVALTLAKLDLLRVTGLSSFWPLLVVALGVAQLFGLRGRRRRRGGAFLVLVGIWLLVNTLGLFGLFWNDSWPVLIVELAILRIVWPHGDEDRAGGLMMLSAGIWLCLVVTHTFGLEWKTAWPLLLVLVGLSLIVKAVTRALPAFLGEKS